MTRRTTISALIVAFAVIVPLLSATAKDESKRKVHVIEQRPFLQALRVELSPMFGYTVNEPMYTFMQVGGNLRFHIMEELFVGGTYSHYFASPSGTFDDFEGEFDLFPEQLILKWFAGGEIAYTPLYGKFILFGTWIVHWNAYITAGAGVTETRTGKHVTGTVGAGTRVFLTRWWTLNVEIKDYLFTEPFKAGDSLINNVVLHAGFSFFIPFGFDYKYPK